MAGWSENGRPSSVTNSSATRQRVGVMVIVRTSKETIDLLVATFNVRQTSLSSVCSIKFSKTGSSTGSLP